MIKCLNFHYSNNTENKENKEKKKKKANCSSFEKLLEISKFIIMDMAIN